MQVQVATESWKLTRNNSMQALKVTAVLLPVAGIWSPGPAAVCWGSTSVASFHAV